MSSNQPASGPTILTSRLTPELRDFIGMYKEAAKTDLFCFSWFFMDRKQLCERVHGPICQAAGEALLWYGFGKHHRKYPPDNELPDTDGEVGKPPRVTRNMNQYGKPFRNLYVGVSRGRFKTTIFHECLPVWAYTIDPNLRIMLTALTQELANDTLRVIDSRITQNQIFRYAYMREGKEWEKSEIWNKTSKVISSRTKHDRTPSLFSYGIGSATVGLHPDMVLTDDPIDEKTMASDDLQRQVRTYFDSIPELLHGAYRLHFLTGTRYGYQDLYNEIETERRDTWGCYIRSLRNPDWTPWFPEQAPEDVIDQIQREHFRSPERFWSQHLMMPMQAGDKVFDIEKVHRHTADEMMDKRFTRRVVGVDAAGVKGDRHQGDWGIICIGGDADRGVWVYDCVKGKLKSQEATNHVVRMIQTNDPVALVIEMTGISQAWVQSSLRPKLLELGIRIQIVEVTPGQQSKKTRIIENGIVEVIDVQGLHIRGDHKDLYTEIERFPSDATYDLLDILSYCVRVMGMKKWYPVIEDVREYKELDRVTVYRDKLVRDLQRQERRLGMRRLHEYHRQLRRRL